MEKAVQDFQTTVKKYGEWFDRMEERLASRQNQLAQIQDHLKKYNGKRGEQSSDEP